MFDTQNTVRISIVSSGDYRQSEVKVELGPVQFASFNTLNTAIDGMTWWGGTTALAGAVIAATNQFDTSDDVNDVMIVLTDGIDGDLDPLRTACANAQSDGITIIAVGYEIHHGIFMETLKDIANNIEENVFRASGNEALVALQETLFQATCNVG